uniref:Putative secreted protein n=1 Tax=Ixodes ricinus TaxID=34613 RepID=A0A6B0TTE6_IXORI
MLPSCSLTQLIIIGRSVASTWQRSSASFPTEAVTSFWSATNVGTWPSPPWTTTCILSSETPPWFLASHT